jgi:hypothetical protein
MKLAVCPEHRLLLRRRPANRETPRGEGSAR